MRQKRVARARWNGVGGHTANGEICFTKKPPETFNTGENSIKATTWQSPLMYQAARSNHHQQ